MESVQLSVSGMSSGAATPRSKLDTLPKEELIRFVKKQVQNLQAAKQKCDALEKKLKACENSQGASAISESQKLQEENAELKEKLQSSNRERETFIEKAKNKESSFHEQKLQFEKDLEETLKELKTAKNDNFNLNSLVEKLSSEKFKFEDMCNSLEEMTSNLSQEITALKQERDAVIEEKNGLSQDLTSLENLTLENQKYRQKIEELKEEMSELKSESSIRNEALLERQSEIEGLKGEIERLTTVENEEQSMIREKFEELEKGTIRA